MSPEQQHERSAPRSIVPWLVAAGALVVYWVTLNRWISMSNASLVLHATGWSHMLPYHQPLLHVLTLPLQWLPGRWTPLVLNVVNAVLAAITLGLLARSVMLLPHDRTRHQRYSLRGPGTFLSIPQRWLPPVLAALVCGLELTFWKNAISATGEMLDLLIFAYLIRSLLEYRVDRKESWLIRFAVIYGVGAANNYALIGYFPAFLGALIWIKGLEFFDGRFLLKMTAIGLCGLCFYLVLPAIHVASDLSDAPLWLTLKANLGLQKSLLLGVRRYLLLIVCIPSVVPVIFMGVRWASRTGDTNAISLLLTELVFPLAHTVFFLMCGVVALFSAYHWTQPEIGVMPPFLNFLTFYYLGALSVGYFAGYLLLVFGGHAPKSAAYSPPLPGFANALLVGLVWATFVLLPAALVYRNLRPILAENSSDLQEYASRVVQSLPADHGVAICDDERRLVLVLGELARMGRKENWVVLDSRLLETAAYNRYLHRAYPSVWPALPDPHPPYGYVNQPWLVQTLVGIATNLPVYYLHPSFGYYFEVFHLEPGVLTHKLSFYPHGDLNSPPATPEQIAALQKLWNELKQPVLQPLVKRVQAKEPNALTAGMLYSRSLNLWGVELQIAGKLPDAGAAFKLAAELNPQNVVAQVNEAFNAQLQKGVTESAELPKSIEERFGDYRSWDEVMNDNGPFDEPLFCFECGQVLYHGNLIRQAGQQYLRAAQLRPNHLGARLMLTQLYLDAKRPAQALATIREVRSKPDFGLTWSNRLDLTRLEITALTLAGETNQAERVVATTHEQGRKDAATLLMLTEIRMSQGRNAEALNLNEELLKLQPDSPNVLLNKAALLIELGRQEPGREKEALPILDQLVNQDHRNDKARLNRAIAQLELGNYDAARRDYELLLERYPNLYRVHFGLAEIGYRTGNRELALKYYRLYLQNAPSGTPEAAQVQDRISKMEGRK